VERSDMILFQFIHGLAFGIEYVEDERMGFIGCLDLGVLRILWYKDVVEV
jgi:hypothetical protein